MNKDQIDSVLTNGTQPQKPTSTTTANTPKTDRRKSSVKRHKEDAAKAEASQSSDAKSITTRTSRKAENLKATISDALTRREETVQDLAETLAYLADENILVADVMQRATEILEASQSDASVEINLNPFEGITIDVPRFQPSASKYLPSAS